MTSSPSIMLVDPAHFNVSYVINPWMKPGDWAADPAGHAADARASFDALRHALQAAGATLEVVPGVPGQPDMVFPANAAIVLDRRAIVARFACGERRGEEGPNYAALEGFRARGLLDEVAIFPEDCFQEGAGDAIWDRTRQFFWCGYGQRSIHAAIAEVARFFAKPVVELELATSQFYHLDTCFCPLSGGEVLFYPPAFTPEASGPHPRACGAGAAPGGQRRGRGRVLRERCEYRPYRGDGPRAGACAGDAGGAGVQRCGRRSGAVYIVRWWRVLHDVAVGSGEQVSKAIFSRKRSKKLLLALSRTG